MLESGRQTNRLPGQVERLDPRLRAGDETDGQEMPAQGIYQQLFWSSDGRRLVGTANLVGRPWNIVVADMKGGKLTQVSRSGGNGGNCTPDWFKKDPHQVIYSNRSTGILPSLGGRADSYGFTTIMQGTIDGKRRKLVFACEGKHMYFACLSPDDKYLVCADDPQDTMVVGELHVLRLSDTPIIIGLKDLSELYPNANSGPVFDLKLPNGTPLRGFEPDWTYAEIPQPVMNCERCSSERRCHCSNHRVPNPVTSTPRILVRWNQTS